jgi:hypothetical protein
LSQLARQAVGKRHVGAGVVVGFDIHDEGGGERDKAARDELPRPVIGICGSDPGMEDCGQRRDSGNDAHGRALSGRRLVTT